MLDSQPPAKKSDSPDPYEVSLGAISIPLPKSPGVSVRLDSLVNFLADQLSHPTTPPDYSRPAENADEEALRQWLARELHDDVTPALTTLLVQIEQLKRRPQADQPNLASELTGYQDLTRQALDNLRRLLNQLRQESVATTEFPNRVRSLLANLETQSGIHIRFTHDQQWPNKIPSRTAHNLVKIVEEALRNAQHHSRAEQVAIALTASEATATMIISDNGEGRESIESSSGHGLIGMHERAALVGGQLRIESSPNQGTTIRVDIPLAALKCQN